MAKKYDNSGTLGKNERKEKDTHPSHSGQCTIDGVDYWISAWVKEGRNGKFFSLSFRAKEQRASRPASTKTPPRDFPDDAIEPF